MQRLMRLLTEGEVRGDYYALDMGPYNGDSYALISCMCTQV